MCHLDSLNKSRLNIVHRLVIKADSHIVCTIVKIDIDTARTALLAGIVAPYRAISPSCGVKFYLLNIITITQVGIHNSQRILIRAYETYAGPRHTQSVATPPSLFRWYVIIHHCLGGILVTNHAIQIAMPESIHGYENALVVSPCFEIRWWLWGVSAAAIVN